MQAATRSINHPAQLLPTLGTPSPAPQRTRPSSFGFARMQGGLIPATSRVTLNPLIWNMGMSFHF